MNEIEKKYNEIVDAHQHGNTFDIGTPVEDEKILPDGGHYRFYSNGCIYWTAQTGAHEVHGLIKNKWINLGYEHSTVGYPVTDESDAGSGNGSRFNDFQHGTIIWKNGTGEAFAVWGPILQKWSEVNRDSGPLGFPITDQFDVDTNERQNKFEGGTIWHTGKYGANILFNNQVCVTNDTGLDVTVRFYNPGDIATIGLSFPLPDGEKTVPANSSLVWTLPAGVSIVKATFNGNFTDSSFQLVSAGGHISFSRDERIRIINNTDHQVTARFYRTDIIPRLFTLPNGEQNIGAMSEIMWAVPQELIDVIVTFDNIGEQTVSKGGAATFSIDTEAHIHNQSGSRVRFLFFKKDDTALLFTLPGGDISLDPGGNGSFTFPADVNEVFVRKNVQPAFLGDNRHSAPSQLINRGDQVFFP